MRPAAAILSLRLKTSTQQSLDVYVVGFGQPGDGGIDHDVLNDMAEAGGHGRNIETADEAAYYHATSSQGPHRGHDRHLQ